MFRLYGRTVGVNDSWARVTFGLKSALESLELLSGFSPVSDVVEDDDLGVGSDADVGVLVGPPSTAPIMKSRGDHKRRLVIVAPNSTWLPRGLFSSLRDFVTDYIGPSQWACDVLRGHTDKSVHLWQHGVDDAFIQRSVPRKPHGSFSVLHMTSSNGQRKGTRELVKGWELAQNKHWLPKDATLTIVSDGVGLDLPVKTNGRLNLDPTSLREVYRSYHVVAQPSRAEGFGMVPLEARVSGVPVIATICSGHADHMNESSLGCVDVPTGEPEPIDDGPGGMAPALHYEDIADSLGLAYVAREELAEAAEDMSKALYKHWSWRAATERFLTSWGSM